MAVISLTAEREKRIKPKVIKHDFGQQYFCMKCDGDAFKLHAGGDVVCIGCGAWMKNLTVFKGGIGTA